MTSVRNAEADNATTERDLRRRRVSAFFRSALRFWRAEKRAHAWTLTFGILAIIGAGLVTAYAMNLWNRSIFDGLQQRDPSRVAWLSMAYFVILAASVALSVAQVYLRMKLQRRWRVWLSGNVIDRWLSRGRYYQLNLVVGDHANPEARIVDDIRQATEAPVDFVSGIVQALLSAITFIFVLWHLGGALDLSFTGYHIEVPGFLVVAALLYALIASGAMVVIGRRFIKSSEDKNQAEAEYRYVLTRLRENGE
ncbi:MAG: SbmA/BacA-like family transporter, partial [Hyphomicrobiaceae bacterium]